MFENLLLPLHWKASGWGFMHKTHKNKVLGIQKKKKGDALELNYAWPSNDWGSIHS